MDFQKKETYMETEIRKTIRLSIEDYKNIEQIKLEHGLADFSKAICYAVQNYPILEKENMKLKEDGQKQMTRIRLASNGADVNVQILMEVINSLCWQLQVKEFRPTDHMLHPAMDEARKVVKERIANYKQAKDFHAKN